MEWYTVFGVVGGALVGLMLLGIPIAFVFGLLNVVAFYFLAGPSAVQAVALSSYGSVATFAFTALPMFVLMGAVIMHAGLAQAAISGLSKWLGRMPGRLGVLSVLSGTLLSGASGSSMADTAVLGRVLVPQMLAKGYDKRLATGCIATCGALAVLIPPSAVMVIMGGISRLDVGTLLIGGIFPGLLLASFLLIYVIFISWWKPHLAPAYDIEDVSWRERLVATRDFLPIVLLIVAVLGSMLAGFATPSEAAAVGAVAACAIAASRRRLSFTVARKALFEAVEVSGLALLIVTTSTAFSQVLAYSGAAAGLSAFVIGLGLKPIFVLISMQGVIFLLGCLMDGISIMLIVVPLFFPLVKQLGYDPIWFAVVTVVNIEIGLITPPFGLNLFVIKAVSPRSVTLVDVYRGSLPFIALNVLVLALVMAFPSIVLWLPQQFK